MRKCTKRWLLPAFAAAMTLAAGFSSLAAETCLLYTSDAADE